ncbi:DUF2635 domain-containing protein [Salmonella enterica]|nr:DUF2635 domain-containing protein [Salmonella enterica]EGL7479605.1 DUF2635 domain-containing protein [Salmonella enterica]EIZ2335793.1 DUF2635 domain-containing protein [Salmonella enterica]
MFVKPVKGRSVRCPVRGAFLPQSGGNVPDDIFWRRRLLDGDVALVTPEKKVTDGSVSTNTTGGQDKKDGNA